MDTKTPREMPTVPEAAPELPAAYAEHLHKVAAVLVLAAENARQLAARPGPEDGYPPSLVNLIEQSFDEVATISHDDYYYLENVFMAGVDAVAVRLARGRRVRASAAGG